MPRLTFETETRKGDFYRVVRVLEDWESVGFVVGRREKPGGPRWWAHYLGHAFPMSEAPGLLYGCPTRQQAVENLLFARKHEGGN